MQYGRLIMIIILKCKMDLVKPIMRFLHFMGTPQRCREIGFFKT